MNDLDVWVMVYGEGREIACVRIDGKRESRDPIESETSSKSGEAKRDGLGRESGT
jgi:hypothetical protein